MLIAGTQSLSMATVALVGNFAGYKSKLNPAGKPNCNGNYEMVVSSS